MNFTKSQLKALIREFVDTNRDFTIDFGSMDPPPPEEPEKGDGGEDNPFVEYVKAMIAELQDGVSDMVADELQGLYDMASSERAVKNHVRMGLAELQEEQEPYIQDLFQDVIDYIDEPPGGRLDEALSKSDKAEIKKMLNQVVDKKLKSELKKVLRDELEKALKSKDIKQDVGEIAKKVIKKLYKDLSFHHPYIIDRIKIT